MCTEDFTNPSIIKQNDIKTYFVGLPYYASPSFHTISFVICGCIGNKKIIHILRAFLL